MTSKIFSVATFIVVSWLAVTVITTSKRVSTLETKILNGMAASSSAMNERISRMERAQRKNHQAMLTRLEEVARTPVPAAADMSALKAETAKLKKALVKQAQFAELKKAYNDVIESELEKYASAPEAAAKLLATKGVIWKTSTKHDNVKDSLQGLMAPIDVLAARWKSGDTQGTVGPVFRVLKQTLATLGADI